MSLEATLISGEEEHHKILRKIYRDIILKGIYKILVIGIGFGYEVPECLERFFVEVDACERCVETCRIKCYLLDVRGLEKFEEIIRKEKPQIIVFSLILSQMAVVFGESYETVRKIVNIARKYAPAIIFDTPYKYRGEKTELCFDMKRIFEKEGKYICSFGMDKEDFQVLGGLCSDRVYQLCLMRPDKFDVYMIRLGRLSS